MKLTPEDLAGYLYGELDAEERRRIEAALADDPAAQRELAVLQRLREQLPAWEDRPLPAGLHAAVMDRVQTEAAGRHYSFGEILWWLLHREVSPALLGMAVAGLALFLHVAGAEPGVLDTRTALVAGLVWGGVYSTVFRAALSQRSTALARWWARGKAVVLDMKRVCAWGLVAFVLAFTVALLTPNPHPFEDRTRFLELSHRIPYVLAYGLPAVYIAIGAFGACLLAGVWNRRDPVFHGMGIGLVGAVLLVLDLWTCRLLDPSIPWPMLAVWIMSVIVAGGLSGAAGGWVENVVEREPRQ